MTQELTKLLERASLAKRESRHVEFKSEFDLSSAGAWCEVIKDIVAIANSGGGVIVFGVQNDGTSSSFDGTSVAKCDPADITNKVAKYTGYQFDGVSVTEVVRGGKAHAAFGVSATDVPIVFTRVGTYDAGDGKNQKTAFGVGTLYFRHGAKSEHAQRDDLVEWRDRAVERMRKGWLGGIKKVVTAPEGHTISVVPAGASTIATDMRIATDPASTTQVRFTTDPGAPAVIPRSAEDFWPHRQKELIRTVNDQLPPGSKINSHDMQCINRRLNVLDAHPEFAHKPHRLATTLYSNAYAELVAQHQRDPQFFSKVRAADRTPATPLHADWGVPVLGGVSSGDPAPIKPAAR